MTSAAGLRSAAPSRFSADESEIQVSGAKADKRKKVKSLTTSAAGLRSAAPAPFSADESEIQVSGAKAGKRKKEESPTTSAVGLPSESPARSSADESEVKRMIHDRVEHFIRDKFNNRRFCDVMDFIEMDEGHIGENVRAVFRAKAEIRKRGRTKTDDIFEKWYDEELKSSTLTADGLGLTCRDIFNIKCYLSNGTPATAVDCSHATKAQSLYGVYIALRIRHRGESFIKVLEKMNEANVPVVTVAILAAITSYLDVPDLCVPELQADVDKYTYDFSSWCSVNTMPAGEETKSVFGSVLVAQSKSRSEKSLMTSAAGFRSAAPARFSADESEIQEKSLMTSAAGFRSAAPARFSADESEIQVSGAKAGKRKKEESPTTSAVGLPSESPARSSADESEVKRMIHDRVEHFIRDKFNNRRFCDVMDFIEKDEGHIGENVRAVFRAKAEIRKRGPTKTDDIFEKWYGEELKSSPLSADGIGLTCRDIFNIESYLSNRTLPTHDACFRAIKAQSLYGAYIAVRIGLRGKSFIKVLEKMNEANVPVVTLAILAAITSYLDVPDLCVPELQAHLDEYKYDFSSWCSINTIKTV